MSKTLKLSSGFSIPSIGFGTGTALFKRDPDSSAQIITAVTDALKAGFTHLDTAEGYGNEIEVGEAIAKSGVKRKDIFITTKLSKSFDDPEGNLDRALKELKTDYVDLYLIHNTSFLSGGKITIGDLWKSFEAIVEKGKAKSIGVSNFAVEHLEELLKTAKIKPAVNQIEYHAYLQNQTPGIVEFAKKNGIYIESYGGLVPLTTATDGPLTPVVEKIAKTHGKSTTQVLLRWVLQNDVISVTTSRNPDRLKEILDIYSFELTPEEVEEITKVGNSYPYRKFK